MYEPSLEVIFAGTLSRNLRNPAMKSKMARLEKSYSRGDVTTQISYSNRGLVALKRAEFEWSDNLFI